MRARAVSRGGHGIDLTPKEFGVLEVLMSADGAVVSPEELLTRVWDENADPFTNTVRMSVMTLRRKLGDPPVIETVKGAGLPDCAYPPLFDPLPPDGGLRAALRSVGGRPDGGQLLADLAPPASHAARRPRRATPSRSSACSTCSRSPGRVLLAVVAGWAVAGRALAPIERITRAARRVSQESLDERIALTGPEDELSELARTFDDMLDRLEQSFDAQRRFVANASHELRSPLTVIRSEAEVALANPTADPAELRQVAEVVIEATKRTEALLDGLMVLARSQQGTLKREPLDLRQIARAAAESVSREARERSVTVALDLAPAHVEGDRRLLERVIANLLENGVRYNSARRLGVARDQQRERHVVRAGRERRPEGRPGRGGPRWRSPSSAWTVTPPTAAPAWGCRSCARSARRTAGDSRSSRAAREA